ncbi:hypothetical protein C1645_870839 [Glomus cerebriforme]|uniref:Sel1 repeat domain-containing protein n=1 Tax=Glomus cerebriforme TaxID=658196 RepID=A0A397TSZ7_9GLOM|nr:hypothetical protein C1645_870839 [Glomus cerebriforme]
MSNININLLHEELTHQIFQNYDKVNIKEIEPTKQNINEAIFEEDLYIVIDELIKLNFKEINEGKEDYIIKQYILDYISKHKINSLEIYNWLLNNQNDSNSIYLLGYFNYHGIETNINKQRAFELYQKAAELDNYVAQICLACMYMNGEGAEINHDKAFKISIKLSEKEYACGLNLLGYCYKNGVGTDINEQKVIQLYQKAADLGSSSGMNNLGICYESGFGIEINKQKAFELYHKAANLGNDFAQYNLALMYENGDGIKQDIDQAIYWYKKSADQGDEDSQNKLEELLNE